MAISRWRWWLEDELTYRRIQICERLPGGHRFETSYDHLNGHIDVCGRCGEVQS
jgi:hypothetical protein